MKRIGFLITLLLLIGIISLIVMKSKLSNHNIKGRIFFQSDRGQFENGLYIIDENGMKFLCEGRMPHLLNDGKELVFINAEKIDSRTYGENNLFLLDIAKNKIKKIETVNKKVSQYASPVFSPDGNKIAFVATSDKSDNVHIIDLSTQNIKQLTTYKKDPDKTKGDFIYCISWMPNSTELVYNVWGKGLFLININNGTQKMLLDGKKISCGEFSISPTGMQIVFAGNGAITDGKAQLKNSELFLTDIEGKHIIQITHNKYEDKFPQWSPDGRKICYTSYRHASPLVGGELFILDPESKKEYKLTKTVQKGQRSPFSGWSTDKYPTWAQ